MIEKLYTVEEVAELASVTGRTIRNYLKSGRLVGRKIGGQWRFPESEVQRLLTGAPPASAETEAPQPTEAPPAYGGEVAAVPPTPAQQVPPTYTAPAAQPPAYQEPVPTAPSVATPPAYAPAEYLPPEAVPAPAPQPAAGTVFSMPILQQPVENTVSPGQLYPSYTAPAPLPSAAPPAQGTGDPVAPAPQGWPGYAPVPPSQPAPSTTAPSPEQTYTRPAEAAAPAADTAHPTTPAPAPVPQPEAPAPTTPAPAETPKQAEADPPAPPLSVLSDVGLKVLQFTAEVHDCSTGPQTCSVLDVCQPLAAAKLTSEKLAQIARQESEEGILCRSYVEYDERYSIARYTLFGPSAFLARCLKLLG